MHPFCSFIAKYTPISQDDWLKIEVCLKQKKIKKGEIILEEGKICKHLYFLESGLLRFFIWKDGNDITKFFTESPYTFTSQLSFSNKTPAKENIEVLEDGILWLLSFEDAYRLLEISAWNTFIRKLIQEVQIFTEEILEEIQTETAENRYKNMLETNPQLIQRIPLRYLASYFGIAPQSLSRIRKNMLTSLRT